MIIDDSLLLGGWCDRRIASTARYLREILCECSGHCCQRVGILCLNILLHERVAVDLKVGIVAFLVERAYPAVIGIVRVQPVACLPLVRYSVLVSVSGSLS